MVEEYPDQITFYLNWAWQREKRRELKQKSPSTHESKGRCDLPSRGDKTAIELFIAGVQGWEAGLRRILLEKQGSDSQP